MTDSPSTDAEPLAELVAFLDAPRADVRAAALDAAASLSGTPDGVQSLVQAGEPLLRALLRRAGGGPPGDAAAARALVNLSADETAATALLAVNGVGVAMDALRDAALSSSVEIVARGGGGDDNSDVPTLLLSLLSNLTSTDAGASALLQADAGPALAGFNLALLVDAFLAGRADGAGPLLANATRVADGRRLLVEPSGVWAAATMAVCATERPSSARLAVAAALRNCALGAEAGGTLASIAADTASLSRLLTPLCGAAQDDGSTTPKDTHPGVRCAIAEAVLALAATDAGRGALWSVSAPEALRRAYEDEDDEGACEAMEHTATLFLEGAGAVEEEDQGVEEGGKEEGGAVVEAAAAEA